MLDESYWGSQYELTFSLWLENAECEFLRGNFGKAEQLIVELAQRAASKVDKAAVCHLKVQYHVAKSENPQPWTAHSRACACSASTSRPPDLGGRSRPKRGGLADPQWAPDREPD